MSSVRHVSTSETWFRSFLSLTLLSGITNLSYFCYLIVSVVLEADGFSPAKVGLLATLPFFVRALIGPWFGKLADHTGHRMMMVIGVLMQASVCAAYVLATGPAAWWGLRILHGIAWTMVACAIDGQAAKIIPRQHGPMAWGMLTATNLITSSAAPIVGESLLARGGTTTFFAATALLCLLALPFALTANAERVIGAPGTLGMARMPHLLLDRRFLAPILVASLAGVNLAVQVFIPLLIGHGAVTSPSYFYVPFTVMAVVIKLVSGHLSRRLSETAAFVIGALFIGAGAAMPALGTNTALVLAGLLDGVGVGIVFPAIFANLTSRTVQGEAGFVLALTTSVLFLATFGGGAVLGGGRATSGISSVFLSGGGFAVGVAVLAILFRFKRDPLRSDAP